MFLTLTNMYIILERKSENDKNIFIYSYMNIVTSANMAAARIMMN